MLARDQTDVDLPGKALHGRRVQEHGIERDVEHHHDDDARNEGGRQRARWILDLVGDIGRGVPARV